MKSLHALEACGQEDERLQYGYVQQLQQDEDPVIVLARSVAKHLGGKTALFEARLDTDQEMLLKQTLLYASKRTRKQNLLDQLLFETARSVKAPMVFHALMDAGANPLKTQPSRKENPSHQQGAIVEALIKGNPTGASAMLEKLPEKQAREFRKQWLSESVSALHEDQHPHVAKTVLLCTSHSKGLLPNGLPDFLNLLEKKTGQGKEADDLRQNVLFAYLNGCYDHGHDWHEDVLTSLAGKIMDPSGSLEQSSKKDAESKKPRPASACESLALVAILTHCVPVIECLRPLVESYAQAPYKPNRTLRISKALEQKGVSADFPFHRERFEQTIKTMLALGHRMGIEVDCDDKAVGFSVLHELAMHNGKKEYPHRMEKLLGLLNIGIDPKTRNIGGKLAHSLVKPPEARDQWQGTVNAKKARNVAHALLDEMDCDAVKTGKSSP